MASQRQPTDVTLERTSSQTSTASRRSGTVRTSKSRKHSLVTSTSSLVTPMSAKTLESFPSLSPDASPAPKPGGSQLLAEITPEGITPRSSDDTPRKSFKSGSGTVERKPSKTGPSTVESLITSSPSFRGRSALFQDSPKASPNPAEVLGNLHHASDTHIQSLIKKKGAVQMIRQFSQDLADRDAEITAFRRRADAREMELKRMLREVEVSNMDIEKRLHRLEGPERAVGLGLQASTSTPNLNHAAGTTRAGQKAGVANGIDEMMGEAMKDDVGMSELDEGYLDSLTGNDKQATVKARSVLSSDGKSVASSVDSGRPGSTLRGWKDYLWKGDAASRKTSRASSVSEHDDEDEVTMRKKGLGGTTARRRGLNDDLFNPPTRVSTTQSEANDRSSRKSSASATSWTVKLFGGNAQAGRDSDRKVSVRGRSATTGDGVSKTSRTMSRASAKIPPVPPVPQSAKAALLKVNGSDPKLRSAKSVQPLRLGANAPTKPTSLQPTAQMPSSPAAVDGSSTNLGPVEMDTIHPEDSKPPTLVQSNDNISGADDLLTDRFGFIYDQRRRKKEAEATSHKRAKSNASANVEMIGGVREPLTAKENEHISNRMKADSIRRPETPMSQEDGTPEKPAKRWQDYLKVATFPTELLSHTPSAQPATTVITPEIPASHLKRSSTSGEPKSSLPIMSLNPAPEMSPVTASNAEFTQTSLDPASANKTQSSTASDVEPVKLLLSQLTEVHDTIQREKTIKWNEFLRKVRAERKKEGETLATSDPRSNKAATPEVTLTDGEMIGVAGLGNKGKVGRAKWKEFKQLVLFGIPVAYRAKIWAECSGASALRVPGYYDDLVANSSNDDPTIVSQIQMDIHRTLTDNVFFRKGPGVTKLNEVLLAYSRRNPEVGYCQGMNLITASLLLIMPTAEDAFWLLTSLIENILPRHYYDHSLLASRADQAVLRQYVSEVLPKLSAHLEALGIELEALTFQWFLSVFTDCLSAEALFRVWDVVLCFNDGSTFLFQVALALLKLNEQQLLDCDNPARIYGYIGNEMTDHAISIDGLIGASEGLGNLVLRAEVEERRWAAVEEQKGKGEWKDEGREWEYGGFEGGGAEAF